MSQRVNMTRVRRQPAQRRTNHQAAHQGPEATTRMAVFTTPSMAGSPTEAAGALRAGVDAFLRHGPTPWSDRQSGDFQSSCGLAGLARQRAEALAAAAPRSRAEPSGSTQTAADRWPARAQERLVADFLASPEGQGLTSPVARSLPRDLVMICVNHLGRDPLPPGPLLFRRLVRDVLPASVVLPTRVAGDVSQAMRAWARWAAGRCDLPKRLRRLLAELEDDLRDFRARLAEANRVPDANGRRRAGPRRDLRQAHKRHLHPGLTASALRANICTEATLQRLGSALENAWNSSDRESIAGTAR